MFNLTKIICTIGPKTSNLEMIKKLISTGMDVARLNFSHGTHEAHLEVINLIRKASNELNSYVAILADLQGPKIRVGKLLPNGYINLIENSIVKIVTNDTSDKEDIIPTIYKNLPKDVKKGAVILLDDGLLELLVEDVISDTEITCRVVKGGILKEKKGINVRGASISAPPVTEKDYDDLIFALKNQVDYIALSFVRQANDINEVKKVIHQKGFETSVIAKIERPEAVENFDLILKAADGIMIARGDLGVEIEPEKVPKIQKMIINKCNYEGKPVIVATQMLESMISNPRPTRAEASDIANAILDGTDAIMLSAETATGNYPIEAVQMMSKIAQEVEPEIVANQINKKRLQNPIYEIADSICYSVSKVVSEIKAKAIVAFTESGLTSLLVSKYRPNVPIVSITPYEATARRINLYWGVIPYVVEHAKTTDQMIEIAEQVVLKNNFSEPGDYIIVVAGVPIGKSGVTNLMKIHKIKRCAIQSKCKPLDETGTIGSSSDKKITIKIDPGKCIGCGICVLTCAFKIFGIQKNKIFINSDNVNYCVNEKMCIKKCPANAITIIS